MANVEHALDLTEAYVRDIALPNLQTQLPGCVSKVALGLVGNGSECFGYDDEFSRDHDWGVDFFVWVPSEDAELVEQLLAWKTRLFKEYAPRHVRTRSDYGAEASVMTVEGFYRSLIGTESAPQTLQQWMRVPEENLAMAVNGRVFFDNPGLFTKTRDELLKYYPEDLRLRRIATACMLAAQAGQYNFARMAKRGDVVTARLCMQRFIEQVEKIVFLLNRKFRPYYKWIFRSLGELPVLGREIAAELQALSETSLDDLNNVDEIEARIEHVCELVEQELRSQGLSNCYDSFIQPHGESVFEKISDPTLKSIPITFEI